MPISVNFTNLPKIILTFVKLCKFKYGKYLVQIIQIGQ